MCVSAEGTSEATVFLCALQIILWFLQSSFRVMAFKHHLSPSQLSFWKEMGRDISAGRKYIILYKSHPRNECRNDSHAKINPCTFEQGLHCMDLLEISGGKSLYYLTKELMELFFLFIALWKHRFSQRFLLSYFESHNTICSAEAIKEELQVEHTFATQSVITL